MTRFQASRPPDAPTSLTVRLPTSPSLSVGTLRLGLHETQYLYRDDTDNIQSSKIPIQDTVTIMALITIRRLQLQAPFNPLSSALAQSFKIH